MKNRLFSLGVMALCIAACSVNELDINTPDAIDATEFFATIEDASTRVFVDDELMVLWHADDRVSIFNKYTYNQQYRFTGNTGANSGSFTKVPNDDFVTGNALNFVYAIYPYKESTEISNQGVLTIDLPATQSYAENTFGIGANTMVSCSDGNELLFKNLCGYIMLKLYGDDVTVKSISIKGNNNEPLAGKAIVNATVDDAPSSTLDASATKEITLSFDTPVTLGTTADEATTFWLVVPPTTFSKGITLTVKDDKNGEFKKSTTASLQVSRNTLKRLTALQVIPEPSDDAIVFADQQLKERLVANYDLNGDGEISYKEAASVSSIEAAVKSIKTVVSFDEFQYFTGETSDLNGYFTGWTELKSIILPESIVGIGYQAFMDCTSLQEIIIPNNVSYIGQEAFYNTGLKTITIPKTVTSIGDWAFCKSTLESVTFSDGLTRIGKVAFGSTRLSTISLPKSITYIANYAFVNVFLNPIICYAQTPPQITTTTFYSSGFSILVPAEAVNDYKYDSNWCYYADYIRAIPETVDLGLPSGIKWASFNLGASKPEEYGDYYAWGEIEPYYTSLNPLVWKEGKEAGYDWDSYIWFGGSTINTQYTFTKYCTKTELWNGKGSPDGKTVLDPEDDAAHVFYGANWRMPTVDEIQELENQCTWEWTTINGIKGEIVTGPNGNSIFLPAAGSSSSYNPVSIIDCGSRGAYWSSSYGGNIQSYGLGFNDHYVGDDYQWRCVGYSIRPVSD